MIYQSGGAFRRALEQRLRDNAISKGVPLVRLRKMVAFDRFLARLIHAQPEAWVLKGGLALQLRLGDRARTTKDLDLLAFSLPEEALRYLRVAAALDLRDWFSFEVADPIRESLPQAAGGLRYQVQARLDGRTFEQFHVDVGVGDALSEPPEYLHTTDLLNFAGFHPTRIPCYPITQQIAEKLHAYTRPRPSGESSRVKDFVDILLLAEFAAISSEQLVRAIRATFHTEATHPIPPQVPPPPQKWDSEFRKMAADLHMDIQFINEGFTQIQGFLDPILAGNQQGIWNPLCKSWNWEL